MIGFRQTLCALSLMIFTGAAIAQNNTNSPYTRYGYGDLSDQYFGNSKAMGGIAYGLRDGAQINVLNPASYTAIDSLTYLFEGGLTLQNMNINANGVKMNAKNSSFDYLAMQFQVKRWLAMSIGLLPYSNIGYNVSQSVQATEDTPYSVKSFTGDGGLHQLYAGAGVTVAKGLSLGVNVSYFWGDLTRNTVMNYPNVPQVQNYHEDYNTSISDYKLDFGIQYSKSFGKKHSITLGGVFSPKKNLNNTTNRQNYLTQLGSNNGVNIVSMTTTDLNVDFGLPNSFGAGFTYSYDNRLTVGADYTLQKWSDVKYMGEKNAFCDRHKLSVGAEIIPNLMGRSYFSIIKYRFGAFYTTPYYKIDGKRAAHEYGVTGGFGLPLPRSRSVLSIGGQFVKMKGLETNFVNENIFRVSIGVTFNERWFFKRKVN